MNRTALFLLLLLAPSLRAQSVVVTLRSTEARTPVGGAVLSLLAPDGSTVAEALATDAARTLVAPSPGTYRVRVRRIGYVPYVSQPIVLAAQQTSRVDLQLPPRRVSLAAVKIRSSFKACGGGFSGDRATSVAWDQIRTALDADVLTERDTLVRLDVRRFVTRERPNGEPSAVEVKEIGESGAQPFGTADPSVLSASGYVVHQFNGTTYWAPDPRVLLSPQFERDHCFRLVSRHDSTGEQIGLAFEPASDRDLPDIRGTLWVRRADNHLQTLEYRYANTEVPLGATKVGGEVAFTSLPSGVWYIRAWSVRLPLVTDNPVDPRRPRFVGYKKVGGVAVPVGSAAVLPLTLRETKPPVVVGARVTVRVVDDVSNNAIDGAVIELQGGAASRISDSTGSARFAAVPQGTTRILVRQIGYQPIDTTMIVSGDSTNVTVALTRIATQLGTVRITAARARAYMRAFESRRRMGIGRFLDTTVFQREAWRSLNEVIVSHFGGVKLVPIAAGQRNGSEPVDLEQFGAMRLEATQPSGILKDTKPTCPIDVYLGGMPFTEDLDAISTDIVGGVELYDKGSAPPEYRRASKACKVLLVWTRAR